MPYKVVVVNRIYQKVTETYRPVVLFIILYKRF